MLTTATSFLAYRGTVFSIIIVPAILLIGFLLYCVIRFIRGHIAGVRAGKIKKFNRVFIILCAMGGFLDFLIIGLISGWDFRPSDILLYLILLIIPGIATQCIYFIPYIIANKKSHPQETAIFILNLFAGWTIIAWIIALVWAHTEPKHNSGITQAPVSDADELMKYKELLDSGVISQEEFNIKKKQILEE